MGFSIQITSYLADSWWPSSLHSMSLEARWHARNKELIATLLPEHLEGSRGPGAYVMALTGPRDPTVTVRKPAGRLDAVVKRQAVQTPGHLLIDAYHSRAFPVHMQTHGVRHAWRLAVHAYAKWNNIMLFLLRCDRNKHTDTYIFIYIYNTQTHTNAHTHNLVSPVGAPDSSALSFQSVSGSSKHPVQLLFLADCTCTT